MSLICPECELVIDSADTTTCPKCDAPLRARSNGRVMPVDVAHAGRFYADPKKQTEQIFGKRNKERDTPRNRGRDISQ